MATRQRAGNSIDTATPPRWLGFTPTVLLLACALSFAACGGQSPSEEPAVDEAISEEKVAAIRSVLDAWAADGMAATALVRKDNQVLLSEAYGMADAETGRPMTVEDGYDIGSLVKPMTATAILRLEEMGELSTDETLADHFEGVPEDKRDITLMQLLTHTSGMQDIFGDDYDIVTRDELLETALAADLLTPPGEEESYSNSGYSLLAMILEDVTGKPYEEAVRELVLEPAGVARIGYLIPGWRIDELAVGYGPGGEPLGTPLDQPWADDGPSWNLRGNGGMLGTPAEVCAWYEALFDGRILGQDAFAKYMEFDGGRAMAHAGGNGIFNTLQVSFLPEDTHLTLFTSHADYPAEGVWEEIREDFRALARGVE